MKLILLLGYLLISLIALAGDFELSAHYQGASYTVVTYGNYAYYNSGGDIHILDISDPRNIHEVKQYIEDDGPILDMVIQDHYLFMTSYDKGVKIFDLSDPLNPEYISSAFKTSAYPEKILVSMNLLISITNPWPLIFDISDIHNPVYLTWIDYSSGGGSYALKNRMLYMSGWYGPNYDLYVVGFDLSDPSDPRLTVSLNLNSTTYVWPDAMEIMNNLLCVAYNDTVKVFDISSRDTIVYITQFATEAPVQSMTTHQNNLIAGMENGKIELFDLTDVYHPRPLGSYQAPGPPEQIIEGDTMMFLAMEVKGFQIVDISKPIEPELIYENTETEAFNCIRIQDSIVFFSHLPDGLQAFDFSDLMHPEPLGRIDSNNGYLSEIESVPGFLYCSSYPDTGLYIIDVRDPVNLHITDTIREPVRWNDFFIHSNKLFIHTTTKQVKIYDLTIPHLPVKTDSFNVDGYYFAGNDSLFVLSLQENNNGLKNFLLLYQYNGDSVQLMDRMDLGSWDYQVFQLKLNFPYILAGIRLGVLVVKISDALKLELTSQVLGFSASNYLCSDEKYIFLAGVKDGTPRINIFNWEDPSQITLYKSIERISFFLAVQDSILISSEGYGGFSVYGYYPLGFPTYPDIGSENLLKVYPNPAGNHVTIDCSADYYDLMEAKYLRVYDLLGTTVLVKKIPPAMDHLDVSTSIWAPGVYIFSLSGKNGLVSTGKVIVH